MKNNKLNKNYSLESFPQLAELYLDPTGKLKAGSLSTFFRSLPLTSMLNFEPKELNALFVDWYGPNIHWELLKPSFPKRTPYDLVIKLSTKQETYFFKRFVHSENALREYLASLYITELNLPYWQHVPIVKMGKLQQTNGQEQIYLISKGANGLNPLQCLQTHSHSAESLLINLANALSNMHARDRYTFSEDALLSQLSSPFTSPVLQNYLHTYPLLEAFYKNFQLLINKFIKTSPYSVLSIPTNSLLNCTFSLESQQFECFNQGALTQFFTSKGHCYLVPQQSILSIILSIYNLHLQNAVSIQHARHLTNVFLSNYYTNIPDRFDLFDKQADLWIHYALLLNIKRGVDSYNDFLLTKTKTLISKYQDHPKQFIRELL